MPPCLCAPQLKLGFHATQEAAARIHDRAVIAVHGRKVGAAAGRGRSGADLGQWQVGPAHGLARVCLGLQGTGAPACGLLACGCSIRLAICTHRSAPLCNPCEPLGVQGAAASGLLNFGVEQYPGEQQRYGPDLNAFLLQLW